MRFYYQDSLLSSNEIESLGQQLTGYIGHLNIVSQKRNYDEPEGVINLPFDKKILLDVNKKIDKKIKWLIVVGIGGSNLGTKAVYDALRGRYDQIESNTFPKIIFLDSIDDIYNSHLEKFLRDEEVLVNLVSKSGHTLETQTNYLLLKKFHDKTFETYKEFSIPETIGGRFSVLSPVGLFPLLIAGFDIDQLLNGAMSVEKFCLSNEFLNNPAVISAVNLFHWSKNGKNIHDTFFFCPELESMGKWYRQLLAESIGKSEEVGITPTVSIGSADMHSVGQLYLGGPKDKLTTFVSLANIGKENQAILSGVKKSYKDREIPFMHIVLDDLSERSLGQFFQLKMFEVIYLGKLFGVNAFDQPAVEAYKKHAESLLSS